MTTDQVILAMQLLGTTTISEGVDLVRQVEAAIAPADEGPHPSNAAALNAERAQWGAIAADDQAPPARREKAAAMLAAIDAERAK